MQPHVASALDAELGAWFRRHRRQLPWRERRDPYRVWISEAMLQQTRVATVIPYFERFVARFPDLAALAAADEAEVLAHWSGLGYYRRARTLQRGARFVLEQHGGRIPATREQLLALPGVGPYTAGAIASLAFDAPEPLVDGNVVRVFARLYALSGAADDARLKKRVWELAAELVPREGGAGAWNEALMELGALVCTPREPRCGECPWRERCAARALGREHEFPGPKSRPAEVAVELVALVVERRGRWLVRQRAAGEGRMAGLWELPTREPGGAARLFPEHWPASGARELFREGEELGELRHSITRHRIRLLLRRGTLLGELPRTGWRWLAPDAAGELALTGMAKKAFARATRETSRGA